MSTTISERSLENADGKPKLHLIQKQAIEKAWKQVQELCIDGDVKLFTALFSANSFFDPTPADTPAQANASRDSLPKFESHGKTFFTGVPILAPYQKVRNQDKTYIQRCRCLLALAAKRTHSHIIQYLVSFPEVLRDITDNPCNTNGFFAITQSAVQSGSIEIVEFFLKLNPKLVETAKCNHPPNLTVLVDAMELSPAKCLPMTKLLLSYKIDPNSTRAMSTAYALQSTEVFKTLVRAGGTLAFFGGNITVSEELAKVNILNCAAGLGYLDRVRNIVGKGIDINAKYSQENRDLRDPVLCAAVSGGQIEVVKFLLEHGADPDITNRDGELPMDTAEKRGHTDILKLLKEACEQRAVA